MANYNVDISIAVKNTAKLTAFNKQLDKTAKLSAQATQGLKEIGQTSKINLASLNNLSTALNKAKKEFNDTVLGTKASVLAARDLASAERMVNKELKEREALLRKFRFQGGGSAFKSFSQSASQITSPNVLTTAQQKSIDRQNRKKGRTPIPFGPQQFIGPLPMQGPMFGPMQGPNPMMTVNNNPRILRNLAASQASREASAFRIRPGTQFERPIGPALSPVMKSINRHAKKIEKHTGKSAQIQTQQSRIAAFSGDPQAFSQPIGPVRPGPLGRLGIGTGANPRGMFASSRGRAGRISGGLSNALIGGGFPLLFGQGALGAAGGGIGGAIGGALGGPFGFGLSIAGTAIATRIKEGRDFQKQIDKVNNSILATGSSATFTARDIKKLGKTLGLTKEEALKAAQSFKAFDASMRTSLLLTFGDEATFNLIKGLKTNVQLINDIQEAETIIGREKADQLLTALRTEGSLKVQKRLQDEIIKLRENERIGNKNKVTNFDRFMGGGRTLGNRFLNLFGQGPGAGNAQVTGEDIRDIRIDKVLGENLENKIAGVNQLGVEFDRAMGIKLTSNIAAVRDELEALVDPINRLTSLAETVGSAFGESFKGIIKGSMTAQEALRNLFMRTADHFLDMAAQMIAKQIQMKILGIGFNMFAGPATKAIRDDFGMSISDASTIASGGFVETVIDGKKATGGPVKKGGRFLVGERGPELFTPGVSGMITPNHALGGSTNVVVNVDASGSSVEGDEQRGKELGRALSVAIQSELIQQKRPGGLLA